MNPLEFIILALALGLGGVVGGYLIGQQRSQLRYQEANIDHEKQMRKASEAAEKRLEQLQEEQRKSLQETRDESARVRLAQETEARERREEIKRQEQRQQAKEESLERKSEGIERRERAINQRAQELDAIRDSLESLREQRVAELERVARMSADEARSQLIAAVEEDAHRTAALRAREIEAIAREEAESRAREIITLAIQRCASDQVSDVTVSTVPLPNDEMKGRIIGREGRNIRALESATGIDLIIDDTPDTVSLSGFDPVRREVARVALTKLILDGRIHPARIEEVVAKARQDIEQLTLEEGERACMEANVTSLPTELVRLIGRLHFRTSYGQNVLNHSIEVLSAGGGDGPRAGRGRQRLQGGRPAARPGQGD